jgi:site-specific recombinase XerD
MTWALFGRCARQPIGLGCLKRSVVVPLSVDAMQYIVRAAGEAAGLGDAIYPHMLRHGAGYALINDGVDVRLV